MTWWEIFIIVAAAIFVLAVIGFSIRRKKQGKSSCGCGCENCKHAGACHSTQQDSDPKTE